MSRPAPETTSPLRILALFIALSEATAGAAAVGTDGGARLLLASFAVVLPLIVLSIFVWLLLRHPGNLYPPDRYTAETGIEKYVGVLRDGENHDRNRAVVASLVTEVASNVIPDSTPGKPRIVQELATEAVHAWDVQASMSGTWWAVLEAHKGRPQKIDLLEATITGEDVRASISRVEPQAQSGRKWEFVGKVRGGYLFGMFYTTTPDLSAMSYGTIQLSRQDRSGTVWSGFYVRMQLEAGLSWSKDLDRIDMRWQRRRPTPPAPSSR